MLRQTSRDYRIREGDTVVIYESYLHMKEIVVTPKTTFNCRAHIYHHEDIVGLRFGNKLYPRKDKDRTGSEWIYVLQPNAELWSSVVRHRTQILYTPDIALVCLYLDLKPGMVVFESGTGSGSLSHAIAKSIAPNGHLHTFDFHKVRAEEAKLEFERNGVGHLVTVRHADVCKGELFEVLSTSSSVGSPVQSESSTLLNLGLPARCLDAAFLDLPNPEKALTNVLPLLKPNAILCSFSPCIEQVCRTCDTLRQSGFADVRMFEVLQRPFELRTVNFLNLGDTTTCIASGAPKLVKRKRGAEDDGDGDDAEDTAPGLKTSNEQIGRTVCSQTWGPKTCSRPIKEYKGHTGYLTFARLIATT